MKQETRDKLLILELIVLIIFIFAIGLITYIVFTKGFQCLQNPLTYGTKVLGEKNEDDLSCVCKFSKQPLFELIVDKETFKFESKTTPISQVHRTHQDFNEINISLLEEYGKNISE